MNSDNHLHLVKRKTTTFVVSALARPSLSITSVWPGPNTTPVCWREGHSMSLQHLFQVQM